MVRRVLYVAIVAALFASVIGANVAVAKDDKPRALILVDGSASMAGYFVPDRSGKSPMARAVSEMEQALGERYQVDSRLYVTTRDGKTRASQKATSKVLSNPGSAKGVLTLTDVAMRDSLSKGNYDTVWIITDNVIDTGSDKASKRDLDRFYARLQSDAVEAIELLPMRLRFKGKIYPSSGGSYEYGPKPRALVVYGLGLAGASRDVYDKAADEVAKRLGTKAFGADRLRAKPLLESSSVKFRIAEVGPDVGLGAGEQALRLRATESSRTVLEFPKEVEEGQPILGVFALEFESDTGPVIMRDIPIDVAIVKNFERGDFAAKGWSAEAKPGVVTVGGSDTPGDSVLVRLKITEGIRFAADFESMEDRVRSLAGLGMLDSESDEVTGSVQVTLRPAGVEPQLDTAFLERWSTNKERDPSRVYRLAQLFEKSHEQAPEDVTQSQVADVATVIRYPWWSSLPLIIPIVALGLLGWAGYALIVKPVSFGVEHGLDGSWELARPRDWDGEIDPTDEQRVCHIARWRMMGAGYSLEDYSGSAVGRLRWLPIAGWVVSASSGYLVEGRNRLNLGNGIASPRRFEIVEADDFSATSASADGDSSSSETEASHWSA